MPTRPVRPFPLLRFATAADAEALSALHGQCFADGWDVAFIERLLAVPGGIAILARESEFTPPCGFSLARVVEQEAELLSLGVVETARRRGAAAALVDAVADACRHRDVLQLFLEVAEGNHAARALYGRAGFAEIGRRRGYYVDAKTGLREDALQLALQLGAAKGAR